MSRLHYFKLKIRVWKNTNRMLFNHKIWCIYVILYLHFVKKLLTLNSKWWILLDQKSLDSKAFLQIYNLTLTSHLVLSIKTISKSINEGTSSWIDLVSPISPFSFSCYWSSPIIIRKSSHRIAWLYAFTYYCFSKRSETRISIKT